MTWQKAHKKLMVVLDFVLMLTGMEKIREHVPVSFLYLTGIEKIREHLPVSFFAFTRHANTRWKSAPVSSNVLYSISEMIRLCCSINPLLTVDSAAVVMTLMFIDSHISINLLFANSPPLSVRNFSADPYICIQQLKMALIIVSGSFDGMTVVAEILVV